MLILSFCEWARPRISPDCWALGLAITCLGVPAASADDKPSTPLVSYNREILPILRKRCGGCHNAEKPRGELDLTSFASLITGGATGKVVVGGNPEESPLYTLPSHLEEPYMPPNAPRLPQRELDLIRGWIEGGLVEKPGDTATPESSQSAEGPSHAPSGGLVAPQKSAKAFAITALAVQPGTQTLVVSGHKQVIVFDIATRKLLGALPFPEGDVFALRFSADGRWLLVGGGVGAESGKAVLFETKGWTRTQTVGDELDIVLAADLGADGGRVVIGGPSRVVKVLANPGGSLVHAFRKPTDWVTAASISPDGLLIAAGDRFGGLFLWEARSGREFLTLRGHARSVNATVWNASSDRLITCGDDGNIRIWDLHTGKIAKEWIAHTGAVLGLAIHADGRIASTGLDRRLKIWKQDGTLVGEMGPTTSQATRVAWAADGLSLISGDVTGDVRVWKLADATSSQLPMPVSDKPVALAFVKPAMMPARVHVARGTASRLLDPKQRIATSANAEADNLTAALESARESAAAAERSVSRLEQAVRLRNLSSSLSTKSTDRSIETADALKAAQAALTSLQSARRAAPANPALLRAIADTEQAIKLLEDQLGQAD